MDILNSSMIFLASAVVAVPIFKRLKLGSILGYLVAGLVIGPQVMDWVSDPKTILHFAELGVVLLLFIIGLELKPQKLWLKKNQIMFTGGSQLLFSACVIGVSCYFLLSFSFVASVVIGLALALSSTAFAIQLMGEHRVLNSPPGQQGFSVLLMQDLAVIPILLLVDGLAGSSTHHVDWWVSLFMVCGVLLVGRYLINPFLRQVSRYGSGEVMTASALLIVIATAQVMQEAGLSMGMGAFIAGILLANSSFRHQMEAEIEPFKGLLLGLFFMAIGMNLDLGLLVSEPVFILSASVILVLIKVVIVFSILRVSKNSKTDSLRIALMLSQGGEFAFVVMSQSLASGLLDPIVTAQVNLVVGISMALTSPLVILHSIWFNSKNCPGVYDTQSPLSEPEIIIAGFGRFGQVSARILAANNIPFTALDKDAQHIAFVEQFGNKVFYGDASRLDLLRKAGIEHARILLIAIDNEEESLKVAELVTHEYPGIKIIARVRNRLSVMKYTELGVDHCIRELFSGGLDAAQVVLQAYGHSADSAKDMVAVFARHDNKILEHSVVQKMDLDSLIASAKEGREELQALFREDKQNVE